MNKQGLKIDLDQVFLLIEEINEFPNIYYSLERVITIINPNLVFKKISIKDISISTRNILTILPVDFSKQLNINHILIITDMENEWSKIRFFEDNGYIHLKGIVPETLLINVQKPLEHFVTVKIEEWFNKGLIKIT